MKKCILALFVLNLFLATIDLVAAGPKIDPIKFTLSTTATHVQLNQEFEIIIQAEYQNIVPNTAFVLKDANSFRLKLILPDGFTKTGGDYYDYVGTELTRSNPKITFKLKGKFMSGNSSGTFELLRSHRNADSQSTFVAVGRLTFNLEERGSREYNSGARIASGTPGFVPYMTIGQLRDNFADTARVVQIDHNGRAFTYRYDSTSTAADDGVAVIVSNVGRRYLINSDVVTPRMYGAKGDGVTDDTEAIQNMLDQVPNNMTIDFQEGVFLFTTATLKNKRNITITGKGATLKGQLEVGSTVSTDPVFEYDATIRDVNFDLAATTGGRAITLANARGVRIDGVRFYQCDKAIYIYPFSSKGIHVSTVDISHCKDGTENNAIPVPERGINYFVYVDNLVKTPPYTGLTFQAADIHINDNVDIHCNISNVVAYGIDGITIASNTLFLSGGYYASQIKERNIHLVATTWNVVSGNKLFEAGWESILIEQAANYSIADNEIAWPGQRDVTKGYGIKITGGGLPAEPTYSNFVISGNTITLPTRSGILIDAGTNYAVVGLNEIVSPGNNSHYYGTGTVMGNSANTPLINSVSHYAIENDGNNMGCLFIGNHCNEADYLFPVNESVNIYKRSRHVGNIGVGGIFASGSTSITSIISNTVDASNSRVLSVNVPAGGTITTITGVQPGDLLTVYNTSNPITLTNNNTSMLLYGSVDASIPFRGSLTLLKQADGFKEVSRTFGFSTPSATETLANKTLTSPTINGVRLPINQVTKTANYTLVSTDYSVSFNSSAGAINATLPDPGTVYANGAGSVFILKKLDNSQYAVTVVGTIDNATNYPLTSQNQSVTVQSNGVGYKIIGGFKP